MKSLFYALAAPVTLAAAISCGLLTIGATIAAASGINVGGFALFTCPLPFGPLLTVALFGAAFSLDR